MQTVLMARIGDRLRMGLINGPRGEGEILSMSSSSVTMRTSFSEPPPPAVPLILIIALPRPKMLRRVLQCAASMGVKRIALIRTWKSEKSYWQSPVLDQENLAHDLILGLEQSGDTVMPLVTQHRLFRPFIEDELEDLTRGFRGFIADPSSGSPCPVGLNKPAAVAIGPERGFIPYEIAMLEKQGFTSVTLGERILRVDVAVPAIISRLFTSI